MLFTSSAVEDRTPGRTIMEVHLGTAELVYFLFVTMVCFKNIIIIIERLLESVWVAGQVG